MNDFTNNAGTEELAAAVKTEAAALGFDACGIARAECVDPEDRLGAWLAAGRHADMEWLARAPQQRREPGRVLAGAQSVIVVARNYYGERPAIPAGHGRVSRYAWGWDYHRVLRNPLRKLGAFVARSCPGTQCYCCIDNGPVMERAWAARAGIGWIGKNSLLVHPAFGSWMFLGVILTTAHLAHDDPIEDRCGPCARCMEACPTGAIIEARAVDSRRCISYHTIENRGEIPDEIQDRMGDWVFGCDACQDVCPWNKRAVETSEASFRPVRPSLNAEAMLAMDEAAFNAAFSGTPIRRAKWAGIQRNCRILRKKRPPEKA